MLPCRSNKSITVLWIFVFHSTSNSSIIFLFNLFESILSSFYNSWRLVILIFTSSFFLGFDLRFSVFEFFLSLTYLIFNFMLFFFIQFLLLFFRNFIFIMMFRLSSNGSSVRCFNFIISLIITFSDTFRLVLRIILLYTRGRFLITW